MFRRGCRGAGSQACGCARWNNNWPWVTQGPNGDWQPKGLRKRPINPPHDTVQSTCTNGTVLCVSYSKNSCQKNQEQSSLLAVRSFWLRVLVTCANARKHDTEQRLCNLYYVPYLQYCTSNKFMVLYSLSGTERAVPTCPVECSHTL